MRATLLVSHTFDSMLNFDLALLVLVSYTL